MNLRDQLAWEEELVERGSKTYWANQDRLRDTGEADKGDAVSYLFREPLRHWPATPSQRKKPLLPTEG